MLNILVKNIQDLRCIELAGRIDSITSNDVEMKMKELTSEGDRVLLFDFKNVTYISSSGLRVFLIAQKLLNQIGGEIVLYNLNDLVKKIFISAGFDKFIKIVNNYNELNIHKSIKSERIELNRISFNNIEFNYKHLTDNLGKWSYVGKPEKLFSSSFTSSDITYINPLDAKFGLGLAGIGINFEEYKQLIGEALIINHNLFVYPSSKRPIVDFILYNRFNPIGKYPFLYGLFVKGNFNITGSFISKNNIVTLQELIDAIQNLSSSNMFALVFISESKGIQGLNLKRPPIIEFAPNNKNIISDENFAQWIDFPIEPYGINCIVQSFGIIKKNFQLNSDINKFFPSGINYHFHSLVYDNLLINKNIESFSEELDRINQNFHPKNVLHLLGESKFKSGLFGVINLGEI